MQVASRASKVLRMVLVGIGEVVKISLPKCCVGMIELRLLHVFFSKSAHPLGSGASRMIMLRHFNFALLVSIHMLRTWTNFSYP